MRCFEGYRHDVVFLVELVLAREHIRINVYRRFARHHLLRMPLYRQKERRSNVLTFAFYSETAMPLSGMSIITLGQ